MNNMVILIVLLVLIDFIDGLNQQHDGHTKKYYGKDYFLYLILTCVTRVTPHRLSAVTALCVLKVKE